MRLNGRAKINNKTAKKDSKAQQEKQKKAEERYIPRICCKKCKESKTTLYNVKGQYYCVNCKEKINKKGEK